MTKMYAAPERMYARPCARGRRHTSVVELAVTDSLRLLTIRESG
jgi:hypothetical protein